MPAVSALAPTWETNKLVKTWFETLRALPLLADRVEPTEIGSPAGVRGWLRSTAVLAISMTIGVGFAIWMIGLFH